MGGNQNFWTLLKPSRQLERSSVSLEPQELRAQKLGALKNISKTLSFRTTQLVKQKTPGQNSNFAGHSRYLWELYPPHQLTLRRVALLSAI